MPIDAAPSRCAVAEAGARRRAWSRSRGRRHDAPGPASVEARPGSALDGLPAWAIATRVVRHPADCRWPAEGARPAWRASLRREAGRRSGVRIRWSPACAAGSTLPSPTLLATNVGQVTW